MKKNNFYEEDKKDAKKIFVFSKNGNLQIEIERFGNVWIAWPYDETSLLLKTTELNENEFDDFLRRCQRYYKVINYV